MNFSGEALLHAPQQQVYDALLDPKSLAHCLPGCEKLDEVAPDVFEAVVSLGIAAVKGKYNGRVSITERQPPNRYAMVVEGSSSTGTVKGTGTIALSEAVDGTKVDWNADVQIGGPIASVGQRLFGGITKLVAGDFFKCMDGQLAQKTAAQEA